MHLEDAIKMVCTLYGKAITDDRIRKPISYALYHTWEYFDAREDKKEKKDKPIKKDELPTTVYIA